MEENDIKCFGINDPNAHGNVNVYPNAMYVDESGVEPTIRTRKIYVPIEAFFVIQC